LSANVVTGVPSCPIPPRPIDRAPNASGTSGPPFAQGRKNRNSGRASGSQDPRTLVLRVMLAALFAFLSTVRPSALPAKSPVIVVVPLGNPGKHLIDETVRVLSDRFRFEVRIASPREMPQDAWYAPRKRWRAERILRALDAADLGDDVWRVAAITDQPISTTKGDVKDWGIAGLGSLDGRSCVFSAYLYRSLEKVGGGAHRHAIENLALHEVGHTLGLPHCPLDRCIMADAKGSALRSATLSINEFCPRCALAIARHLRADEVQGAWTEAERAQLRALGRLAELERHAE
jgi:archaemetzincin